jgi:uncharacterized protein DUF222/HNH endonuclease
VAAIRPDDDATGASPRGSAEPSALPLERLEAEIAELAAHIHAATCRWLLMVAEFDRRCGWGTWGCRSCAQWLSWRCGLAPSAAREHLRVARRLCELPLLRESFGRGELSYSKVRAITRAASPETEQDLLDLARHATAAQLERLVRGYRDVLGEKADWAHRERYLSWSWDDDGSLLIRGRLPAEDGALVMRALEAAGDELRGTAAESSAADSSATDHAGDASAEAPSGASDAEPRDPRRRTNADALLLMADTVLARGVGERSGGERYQVVVHVDHEAMRDDRTPGRCQLEDGSSLSGEAARRLACDASVVWIAERDGRPLSVGRKTRTIPAAVRRALRSRDRSCCFPGCGARRFVDAHHIQHWAQGGETKLSNLMLLCRHHHRLLHEGGFRVERPPGRDMVFRRPDGRAIPVVPRASRGDPHEARRRSPRQGLDIGPDTSSALSAGDRLDYAMAIDGLLEIGLAEGGPAALRASAEAAPAMSPGRAPPRPRAPGARGGPGRVPSAATPRLAPG